MSVSEGEEAIVGGEPEEPGQPFLPLVSVFGDTVMSRYFSQGMMVECWLQVERELAAVQAELGVIPAEAATAISAEVTVDKISMALLRERTRLVGYPILPMLEQITASSSPLVGNYLHWGATTQDIMDTGIVLQIAQALQRIDELELSLGNALAEGAECYRAVTMPGRTHAQQAVPTTFGAKMAVWLAEMGRHVERLDALRSRILVVQLSGAGGTAASLGLHAREIRHRLAARLGLGVWDVPWHTARDGLAELGFVLAAVASTCAKIAREVIELSRTEIGEVHEPGGRLGGASSTMPQKANPIRSEVVVGMSTLVRDHVPALLAAMQAGHERAAGEWQVEWDALPTLFALTGGCLLNTRDTIAGLRVSPERMRVNLEADGGMLMAEAVMMALAPRIGRARAHDVVYDVCAEARTRGVPLRDVLPRYLDTQLLDALPPLDQLLSPDFYLGESETIVTSAIEGWWVLQARRDG